MALAEDMPEEQPLRPDEFIAAVLQAENIAELLDEDQLGKIAQDVTRDYEADKGSMGDWLDRMERGLELARLVKQDKAYPFKGAANVKYPLITSAALQFNARAYPAIVPGDRTVKAKVWGDDPQGLKAARAERISEHMSWQLTTQIPEWEEETDKLLTMLPIVGTMVRKWWYDPVESRARCRVVDPGKFIVHNRVKNLNDAPRSTEEIDLYPYEIESRIRSGQFIEFEYKTPSDDDGEPQEFIEQHCRLDLDEDGYPEPYIVTIHVERAKVVRIVPDFSEDDVTFEREMQQVPAVQDVEVMQPVVDQYTGMIGQQPVIIPQQVMTEQEVIVGITAIKRSSYFVTYQFAPSMDGGFWGTGLGMLLGDISDSINSILNMLLDAGHYASAGGGFIGAELRMKGGAHRRRPGEWTQVQTMGNDVRSAIVPFTVPGPDATLFQMLGLLIEAGREIASVKDVMTGDAPRNQTATATLAMIEQGQMVFTAVFKRVFRALKGEYQMLGRMNGQTISPEEYNAFHDGEEMFDPAQDYGQVGMDVEPVADPRSVTKMQMAAKAEVTMQMAQQGMFNPQEAAKRVAEAMDIPDVEELLPQPNPMQQMAMQMQMAAGQAELMLKKVTIEGKAAEIEETKAKTMKALAEAHTEAQKADLERSRVALDAMKMELEHEAKQLGHILSAAKGMAGPSGNAGPQGSHGHADHRPQGPAIAIVPPGPTGPGF